MNITYTGRNVDVTSRLREFTENKLRKVTRLLHGGIEIDVIMGAEKKRVFAEILVKERHNQFTAQAEGVDLPGDIQAAVEKVEKQARRTHKKIRERQRRPRGSRVAVGAGGAEEE